MTRSQLSNKYGPPIVADLARFDRGSLSLVGGKAANLGELIHAGFDVPHGFVVTTIAYDMLMQRTELRTRIPTLLGEMELGDLPVEDRIGRDVREAMQTAPIPGRVKDLISRAYKRHGCNAVAVRSSATAEDLPGATGAGQQVTFLNVIGEQAVINAVRACWSSLWSTRAILYRMRQGLDQTAVKLAVVVQEMVPADISGVMFTADPLSGARDSIVVDASSGLGEAVVTGVVTPDHFVLDKRRFRVRKQILGGREIVVRAKAEGGIEQIPGSEDLKRARLPVAALCSLARTGVRIERHFAAPQDIEWAWIEDGSKAGKLLILQARPMTALAGPQWDGSETRMIRRR